MGVIVRQKVKGKGDPWWILLTQDHLGHLLSLEAW